MKNKKKILSLLACLSLLTSCNKSTPYSSSCKTTTSTPSVEPTPTPTPEKLNIFDYAITSAYSSDYQTEKLRNKLILEDFSTDLTDEMKLTIEEIHIPEEINGVALASLRNKNNGLFNGFNNLKRIFIPKTIFVTFMDTVTISDLNSSPFINLPSLENIIVDEENEYLYSVGNCLLIKQWNQYGFTGSIDIVCGWKDVEIPEQMPNGNKITTIRNKAFSNNKSITSIKLNKNINKIDSNSFKNVDNLINIDLNENSNFKIEGNNFLYDDKNNIYAACGDVVVPDGFTSIILSDFTSITSIDFNKCITIKKIDTQCFSYLNKLKSITIPATITSIAVSAFWYLDNLNEIISKSPYFKVDDGTNCLYNTSQNKVLAGYKDVIIPDNNIKSLDFDGDLKNNTSITSIKIGKNVSNIEYNSFNSINLNREIKDYFKLTVDEENPYFYINGNSLIKKDGENSVLIDSFPNKDGVVEIPGEVKTISTSINGLLTNPKKIKKIIFNEGLEEITKNEYIFSKQNLITEINLPSTIKKIVTDNTNGANFLNNLSYLEKLTINNTNENDYFYVEGNCLIEKNGNSDGTDKIITGWGDVIIPTKVTTLGVAPFSYALSIKSLTIHNQLTSIIPINSSVWSSFANITLKNRTLNYLGTITEFKTKKFTNNNSLYDAIVGKIFSKTDTFGSLYFLDDTGNKTRRYTFKELTDL